MLNFTGIGIKIRSRTVQKCFIRSPRHRNDFCEVKYVRNERRRNLIILYRMIKIEMGIKYQENSWILMASNDQRMKVKYRVDEPLEDKADLFKKYLRKCPNR